MITKDICERLETIIEQQEKILEILKGENPNDRNNQEILVKEEPLETKVSKLLNKMNIPCSILGYRYLREAIIICVQNPERVNALVKVLYPEIAERMETSASRVERAIRHAIQIAFKEPGVYREFFNNKVPKNSQFIALIAERIRLKEI